MHLLALTLVSNALACPEHMAAAAGSCASGGGGGMVGTALLAAVAALGWAVLRFAGKESAALKWSGQAVGWVLLAGGLAGFLCGALCHASSRKGSRSCDHHGSSWGGGSPALPPGHPPLGEKKP